MTGPIDAWSSGSSVAERYGPLLFVGLLLAVALGGMALGVLVLTSISGAAQHGLTLRAWGVLGEEETLTVLHDHSGAGDGTAGCLVTGSGRLVRWDERQLTGSVTLLGARIRRSGYPDYAISVQGADGELTCPCRDEADVSWLYDGVLRYTADPSATAPHRPLQSD